MRIAESSASMSSTWNAVQAAANARFLRNGYADEAETARAAREVGAKTQAAATPSETGWGLAYDYSSELATEAGWSVLSLWAPYGGILTPLAAAGLGALRTGSRASPYLVEGALTSGRHLELDA
ncbi:MAG: hypothetical protein U0229_15320 [Anaeromyxobacter sp.]